MYTGTKRRVFISHHKKDKVEVDAFIWRFATQEKVFTPYVLGANNNDTLINSSVMGSSNGVRQRHDESK